MESTVRSFIMIWANIIWPPDIIAWPVTGAWSSFYDKASAPNWKWNRLSLAASGLSLGLQLCSWIAMHVWEQQSFHGTSLDGLLLPLNQCQLSTDSPSAIQHCYEKNVPTGVVFNKIFEFKTLLEASSLEEYFSFEYQTWNDGMRDVHRPPTLTSRSCTGAAKPTLWPTLNPCHFTVLCFIFKTKTFSFSSKQALSNNVFWCENRKNNNASAVVQKHQLPAVEICMHAIALPSLWHVRSRPGNALDNAGLPRCTHPDNNSASLFCSFYFTMPESRKSECDFQITVAVRLKKEKREREREKGVAGSRLLC